jgi:hypothetical protein
MKLALLVRFYPARWRERYGEEIADLLATEPPSVPRAVDMVRGLIDAHRHPELVDSALAAVPAAGERSAEMRTHGTGTVARLARVAMLTVLIGLTPVATGAVGYYLGRSHVSPVAEPAVGRTYYLLHGAFDFPVWGTLETGIGTTRANLLVCGTSRVGADGMFYWDTEPCH